jgi:hypothetical protein
VNTAVRIVAGLLLIAHGLVHLLYLTYQLIAVLRDRLTA